MVNNESKYIGASRFGDLMQTNPNQIQLLPMPINSMAVRMKELRIARGLTQGDVAQLVGVTRSAVSQWEAGSVEGIGLQPFLKLLSALNTDWEFLVHGRAARAKRAP